jgi:HTH-like domain
MTYAFIAQRCSDLPVVACCRAMGVSTSGFYAWQANPVSRRDWHDAVLTNTMFDIHAMSRRSYGSPRVHAELVLGQGERCSRKRVVRLMAQAGIVGIHRRKFRGCTPAKRWRGRLPTANSSACVAPLRRTRVAMIARDRLSTVGPFKVDIPTVTWAAVSLGCF